MNGALTGHHQSEHHWSINIPKLKKRFLKVAHDVTIATSHNVFVVHLWGGGGGG